MALQWTTVQPVEPGLYWAAYTGETRYTIAAIADDGTLHKFTDGQSLPFSTFDLWSWPVEVPPTPIREPAKETTDVPPTPEA